VAVLQTRKGLFYLTKFQKPVARTVLVAFLINHVLAERSRQHELFQLEIFTGSSGRNSLDGLTSKGYLLETLWERQKESVLSMNQQGLIETV